MKQYSRLVLELDPETAKKFNDTAKKLDIAKKELFRQMFKKFFQTAPKGKHN